MKPDLQTLTGMGTLEADGQRVAQVRYRLDIRQEWIDVSTLAERARVPGLKSVTGMLTVVDGAYLDLDQTYTLRLEDDRQCQVRVQGKANLTRGTYPIRVTGIGDL